MKLGPFNALPAIRLTEADQAGREYAKLQPLSLYSSMIVSECNAGGGPEPRYHRFQQDERHGERLIHD